MQTSLNTLLTKLASGNATSAPEPKLPADSERTDATYVEKLANAVEYLANNLDAIGSANPVVTDPAPATVSVTDTPRDTNQVVSRAVTLLKERHATRVPTSGVTAVLAQISRAPTEVIREEAHTLPSTGESVTLPDNSPDSVELSLANILNAALNISEQDVSPDSIQAETDNVRGDETGDRGNVRALLVQRLRASTADKVGG